MKQPLHISDVIDIQSASEYLQTYNSEHEKKISRTTLWRMTRDKLLPSNVRVKKKGDRFIYMIFPD